MPYWFDGNNLIGQSAAAARADPRTRAEFLSSLVACRRAGGGRFLVYFDGDDTARSASPPGVSVRYSAPETADEAILQRLRGMRNPSEIIVVTNDRGLAARCRAEGASVLTWSEFTARMQSRRARPNSRSEPMEKVDVDIDDWMKYFEITNDE